MPATKSPIRIYDAATGKSYDLESLIRRLGIQAVAQRYGVSESAVRKWLNRVHRPSRKTVIHPLKKLL